MRPTQSFSTSISVSWSTDGTLHAVYPRVLVAATHVHVYCQHPFIHLDKLVRQIETSIFLKRKQCNGKAWTQIPSTKCPYLSNTLTNNLCSALLNFSFFASFFTVVLLYSTVMWRQYCIQFHVYTCWFIGQPQGASCSVTIPSLLGIYYWRHKHFNTLMATTINGQIMCTRSTLPENFDINFWHLGMRIC